MEEYEKYKLALDSYDWSMGARSFLLRLFITLVSIPLITVLVIGATIWGILKSLVTIIPYILMAWVAILSSNFGGKK